VARISTAGLDIVRPASSVTRGSRVFSILDHTTDRVEDDVFPMDMIDRRIREVFATLLSRGAKVLERTAGELEQAASDLRQEQDRRREEAERVWSEELRREPDTMIRSAPLRAVPDTPADEAPADEGSTGGVAEDTPWTPPEEPPERPEAERPGDVDAEVAASAEVAGAPEEAAAGGDGADRLVKLSAGTVSQIRTQLGDLSPDELRRLREIELANRNRTTLVSAIDRALILVE
jgi:hypothetical protein